MNESCPDTRMDLMQLLLGNDKPPLNKSFTIKVSQQRCYIPLCLNDPLFFLLLVPVVHLGCPCANRKNERWIVSRFYPSRIRFTRMPSFVLKLLCSLPASHVYVCVCVFVQERIEGVGGRVWSQSGTGRVNAISAFVRFCRAMGGGVILAVICSGRRLFLSSLVG